MPNWVGAKQSNIFPDNNPASLGGLITLSASEKMQCIYFMTGRVVRKAFTTVFLLNCVMYPPLDSILFNRWGSNALSESDTGRTRSWHHLLAGTHREDWNLQKTILLLLCCHCLQIFTCPLSVRCPQGFPLVSSFPPLPPQAISSFLTCEVQLLFPCQIFSLDLSHSPGHLSHSPLDTSTWTSCRYFKVN